MPSQGTPLTSSGFPSSWPQPVTPYLLQVHAVITVTRPPPQPLSGLDATTPGLSLRSGRSLVRITEPGNYRTKPCFPSTGLLSSQTPAPRPVDYYCPWPEDSVISKTFFTEFSKLLLPSKVNVFQLLCLGNRILCPRREDLFNSKTFLLNLLTLTLYH